MRAVIYTQYGAPDVLQFCELSVPTPKDNEILVKLRATTVTSADWRVRSLSMPRGFGPFGRLAFGVMKPRQPILGTELAGDVIAVGRQVTQFKPGDAVFAYTGARMGCHVEYKCLAADSAVALKPTNLSYAQAAALSFGGATMLDFYRRANLQSGERVLVNGASGAVGTAAVQLARHFGAHVTAVCSKANAAMLQSVGAQRVLDYAAEDFAQPGAAYDVVVDTVGNAPFARSAPVLAPGGRLLLVLADLAGLLTAPWHSMRSGKRVIAGPVAERAEYIHTLRELAQAGAFTPVIDRIYSFDQMRLAHAYVDQGRKRGNVVVRVGSAQE
jgi:NADPH:quinone reductase-like Zn-dependent oxidoreductase